MLKQLFDLKKKKIENIDSAETVIEFEKKKIYYAGETSLRKIIDI